LQPSSLRRGSKTLASTRGKSRGRYVQRARGVRPSLHRMVLRLGSGKAGVRLTVPLRLR